MYDGLCGFCNGTVRFILAHDRSKTMRFATLQGPYAAEVVARHPELRAVDTVVLVVRDERGERYFIKSGAVLEVTHYLGGAWKLLQVGRIIPRFLRDAAYDAFAGIRYKLFGRYGACPVPSAETRARFID